MVDKLFFWTSHVLVVSFFTGVFGCLMVVILSWISILKSGFSRDD
jgi:hypothetical protein